MLPKLNHVTTLFGNRELPMWLSLVQLLLTKSLDPISNLEPSKVTKI